MGDPFDAYRRLRLECPVGRSERHGGFWVVSRYRDVCQVAGDPERYCSGQGIAVPTALGDARVEPQESDGDRHAELRAQMNSWFTPGRVLAMRPLVEELSRSLLARCTERTSFDLADDYALPLASLTMLRVLGVPPDYERRLRGDLDVVLHERGAADRLAAATEALYRCVGEILSTGSPDGLIAEIGTVVLDGRPVDGTEQASIVLSLLFAGLETSALAIATTAWYLATQPDLRERLLADPTLRPNAVDEFLRVAAPVQAIGRTVTAPADLGGQPLEPGDRVLVLFGSANRDEEEFPDPEEVVLDRRPNRHVTFGYGVHRCLGRYLARLELDVALDHMLTLLPAFATTPHETVRWSFGENRGIRSLPVTLTGGGASDNGRPGDRAPKGPGIAADRREGSA